MTEAPVYLHYELHDGYIQNWLLLGPQLIDLNDADAPAAGDRLARSLAAGAVEPAEPDADVVTLGAFSGQWHTVRCLEDHWVTPYLLTALPAGSSAAPNPRLVRCWAYAELENPGDPGMVQVVLSTAGSATLWVNGEPVGRSEVAAPRFKSANFDVPLEPGRNQVLVCFDARVGDLSPHAMALRVVPASESDPASVTALQVALPTRIEWLPRRNWLEAVFAAATLPQLCFNRRDKVRLTWPGEGAAFPSQAEQSAPEHVALTAIEPPVNEANVNDELPAPVPAKPEGPGFTSMTVRVQSPDGGVYGEANPDIKAGTEVEVGHTYRYPDGPLDVVLMPRPREYYQGNMRVSRRIRVWSLDNNRYTDAPAAGYQERRQQSLLRAARREANVYSEIAKMAVGWWSKLEPRTIAAAIDRISAEQSWVYQDAVGLLAMVARYGDAPKFPEGIAERLSAGLPALVFYPELPAEAKRDVSEGTELLSAVGEILAGQLFPEQVFTATGQTGQWHRERGERRALVLMRRIATRGLRAWGSGGVLEEIFLALAHLVDFAEDETVWNMAMVLMDKQLFALATLTSRGILGGARAQATTADLLGGYLDPTSGISKLMWGAGIFTPHIRAEVSLACMEDYEFPVLLQRIATGALETALWSVEHHAPDVDVSGATLATYRTPDFMLSSVQDYRPGTLGDREHVWQATLGAGATVFVNHPVCASLEDACRPNFWRGNGRLPRVAQWQDALIALYRLPADADPATDDWMGFTHAYFPQHAFDEVAIHDGWAFARKGDGYLALRARQTLSPFESGAATHVELRSYGTENAWLCQMGRAALDGDFSAFQKKVVALPVVFDDLTGAGVRWTTLRGDALTFNWSDPLTRNGEPVVFDANHHIRNNYCVTDFPAGVMDIRYGDVAMRLDFGPEDV